MNDKQRWLIHWVREFRSTPDWQRDTPPIDIDQIEITRVRELLREKGIDPNTCVISWADGEGWVVTEDRHVFLFYLGLPSMKRPVDMRTHASTCIFITWDDITHEPKYMSPYQQEGISTALEILDVVNA